MSSNYYRCRTSTISKIGCYSALYLYPTVGVALLFISMIIGVEVNNSGDYTVEQLIVLSLATVIAILLSSFLLSIGGKCYRMETRQISIDAYGFTIREGSDMRYAWETIEGICVIAYAANANKQNYQTQICIFLKPVSEVALRKLRDSYLFGAFNLNMAPRLYSLVRTRCTPSSLETEQCRRRGCTLTQPILHGIIDLSKCWEE